MRCAAAWLCGSVALAVSMVAEGDDITATPVAVVTGPDRVLLRVTARHSAGPDEIRVVAAEVQGGGTLATFPALFDDGTHGDEVAGDGIYSLETSLSGPPGERTVIYYVVDSGGVEVVTEPASFRLE